MIKFRLRCFHDAEKFGDQEAIDTIPHEMFEFGTKVKNDLQTAGSFAIPT